jgi:phage shock protein C
MSTYERFSSRGFYRSADRAMLGGVCAGFADYFGLNLRVIRFLAIIAFIVAMPMALIVYVAIVLLIPARAGSHFEQPYRAASRKESGRESRKERRARCKRARRNAKQEPNEASAAMAAEVRSKCQSLEERLASLEKTITSSRYQLDREIRSL